MSDAPEAPSGARAVAVIPARRASTRLPDKALADVGGAPLVVHTARRVSEAKRLDGLIVATDDPAIVAAVHAHGFAARLTDPSHPSGTDRVGEVARDLRADIVIGVQGDEPEIEPALLDTLVARLEAEPDLGLCTPVANWPIDLDPEDPNRVKVVTDARQRALYFSRARIPADRGSTAPPEGLHIGVYAWRRPTLERFVSLPPGRLEVRESLEQLRALEHGIPIGVVRWPRAHAGIDTPADLAAFRARFARDPAGAASPPSADGPGVPDAWPSTSS